VGSELWRCQPAPRRHRRWWASPIQGGGGRGAHDNDNAFSD
jgi:hypothetical protein